MAKEEFKDIIYSDWYLVKQQIWVAWDSLRIGFTKLVSYKLKGIDPQESRSYISCCESLTLTYLMIGSRYAKHLEDKKEVALVKKIYNDTIKGKKPTFKEISQFIEITERWFDVSGMSKIEREQQDPGDSVLEDR